MSTHTPFLDEYRAQWLNKNKISTHGCVGEPANIEADVQLLADDALVTEEARRKRPRIMETLTSTSGKPQVVRTLPLLQVDTSLPPSAIVPICVPKQATAMHAYIRRQKMSLKAEQMIEMVEISSANVPRAVQNSNRKHQKDNNLVARCRECQREFTRVEPCKDHIMATHMDIQWFCGYCMKSFCSRSAAYQHLYHDKICSTVHKPCYVNNIKTRGSVCFCDFCGAGYATEAERLKHMIAMHHASSDEKPIEMDI